MRISSINDNTFKSKCLVQGSVSNLKEIAANVSKNSKDAVVFHPSGVVYSRQPYADIVIANGSDVQIVNNFLKSDKVFSKEYGEFGTPERAKNIYKSLWKEDAKSEKAETILNAMNNNRFNYQTLDIQV